MSRRVPPADSKYCAEKVEKIGKVQCFFFWFLGCVVMLVVRRDRALTFPVLSGALRVAELEQTTATVVGIPGAWPGKKFWIIFGFGFSN